MHRYTYKEKEKNMKDKIFGVLQRKKKKKKKKKKNFGVF